MAAARAPDPGEAMAKQTTFEVLTESGLDVTWDVAGECAVLPAGGQVGLEFYQLLSYKGDVDLEKKLARWERFYNLDRPHGAHSGKSPYEALRSMLK